jgi:hypothetical protein
MPGDLNLSTDASRLLRLHFEGGSLRMGGDDQESLAGRTVEETRDAYRELVRAGLMEPVHTFVLGRDSRYRLTEAAVTRREALLNDSVPTLAAQSFGARRGPRG